MKEVSMVEPKIFRQYDIRGVWGKDLTVDAVKAIGTAFACYLKENLNKDALTVSIGYDARQSSPAIAEALTGVLTASGVNVINIGMCPTPLQYFSLNVLEVDGGVMITGSHNPPEYNGLKLSLGKETLYGEKIQDIRRLIEAGKRVEGAAVGTAGTHEIIPQYVEYVTSKFGSFDGLKVVVDAGNGAGGVVGPDAMRRLGADVTALYCEPDGTFPNHHPDPVVLDNLRDLIAKVKEIGAHVGIGYDGDADRIGVVDAHGNVIWGDRLMIVFGRDILKDHPGATIIGEVKCSQTLYDDLNAKGGNAVMWKTGHSLIKNKMKETGALLAGEMSGHIFFADRYFGYDDAIYAGLRLLEIVKKHREPYDVAKLLEGVPKMVATPEIRMDFPDDKKFEVPELMKAVFKDYPLVDIDGIRIKFPDGWGLIRASNTQPALVLRFEASDKAALDRIQRTVDDELQKVIKAS
jgi:phosphomannomutase/phosphoglucomutase